jgi:hypothetical protein
MTLKCRVQLLLAVALFLSCSFNIGNAATSSSRRNISLHTLPLTLSVDVSGTIASPGEQDRFAFQGAAGQRLYYDALELDSARINARLVAPSGAAVWEFDQSSDFGPFYLIETGSYTLVLDGMGDNTGDYHFRLIDLASATPLSPGIAASGQLASQNQTRVYRFDGAAGQWIKLDSIAATSNTATWRLVSPAGNRDLVSANITTGLDTVQLPVTGAYAVLVEGRAQDATPLSFQIVLSVVSNPTGTPHGFGQIHGGTLAAGETNTFAFQAPAGLVAFLDNPNNTAALVFELRDPDDNIIQSTPANLDLGPVFLAQSGTYTIAVRGADSTSAGEYQFRFLDLSTNAIAMSLGATTHVLLDPGYRTEVYRFNGAPGQRLYLDILGEPLPDVLVRLIAPTDAALLQASYQDFGLFTLPDPGAYFLIIEGRRDTVADFSFRLIDLAQPPAAALALDSLTSGTLEANEVRLFQFQGAPSQRLFIDAKGTNSNGYWALVGPSNQQLVTPNLTSDFEATLPQSGDYALILSSSSSAPVPYSFHVAAPGASTNSLALGGVITGNLTTAGEEHHYPIAGTAGQRLYYDALDTDFDNIAVRLLDPRGNIFAISGNSDSDFGPFTLTETGIYTIVLGGKSDTVGNYSFRLIDALQFPAAVLPLNRTINGSLDPSAEVDIFRFNGVAGKRLFFDSRGTNYNGNWTLIAPNNQDSGAIDLLSDFGLVLQQTGLHLVLVRGVGPDPVPYTIRVITAKTTNALLNFGSTTSGELTEAGEEHRFAFAGMAGQRLYYDALDTDMDNINARLYDPSGDLVFINGNSDIDAGPFTLTEPGTYTLVLGGNTDALGNYSFRLLDLSAVPLLTLGTTITGQIQPLSETDGYRFHGTAGQRLVLESFSAEAPGVDWALVGPLNQSIVAGSINADLGTNGLSLTGDYMLLIRGIGAQDPPVDYQVRLSDVTDSLVTPSGFDTLYSGAVSPGETNSIAIAASAGVPLYLDKLSDDLRPYIQLLDPAGDQIFYLPGLLTDAGPYYLPRSGSYTFNVIGATDATYNFRVLDLATSAIDLVLGIAVTNTLEAPYATQIYRFTGTAGQRVYYDGLASDFGVVYVRIVAPSGGLVLGGIYWGGYFWVRNDAGPFTLTEPGTYYLIVESLQDAAAGYSFSLIDVSQAPSQQLTLNKPIGTNLFTVPASSLNVTGSYVAINLRNYAQQDDWRESQTIAGTRREASLNFTNNNWDAFAAVGLASPDNGDESNWENFSVQWDGFINLTNANTRLYLRSDNSSRFWIDLNRDGIFKATWPEFVDNRWGEEIVQLSPPSAALPAGNYRLRVQYEESYGNNELVLLQDGGASLDSFAAAVYRLEALAETRLFLDSFSPLANSATWSLFGPNNQLMKSGSLAGDLESTLGQSGTYLLVLSSDSASPVSYGFRVLPATNAPLSLGLGTSHSGVLLGPGEEHQFNFAGQAGQRVYYDALDGDSDNVSVGLTAPSGSSIDYGQYLNDFGPITLTESGSYTLALHNRSDRSANYKFRLLDLASQPVLTLDTTNTLSLNPGTTAALFRISGAPGLRLFIDSLSQFSDGYLALYGPNDQNLWWTFLGADFEYTPIQPGQLTLVLNSKNTNAYDYSLRVLPGNHAPSLLSYGNQTIAEMTQLYFPSLPRPLTRAATDAELPNDVLTFSLEEGAPAGLHVDPYTGIMSWTPTEEQGPGVYPVTVNVSDDGEPSMRDTESFTITVAEVNRQPTLTVPGNQTINELTSLTVTLLAADPDLPANTLSFGLISPPEGISLNPNTGVLAWLPSEAQGPSTNIITLRVTDNGAPNLSATNSFTVVVREANSAPVLTGPAQQIIAELSTLTLTNFASDSDVPANKLAFSLVNAPAGVNIDSATGILTWTPTEAQGPSTNSITVRVTDDGAPSLSATNSIAIVVNEVNAAPVLSALADKTIHAGASLAFRAMAADSDIPANTLTYSLDPGAPTGAAIHPSTGDFSLTSTGGWVGSTNLITVRVADNGSPNLGDAKTFAVAVVSPPILAIARTNELVLLYWSAIAGNSYRVQYKDFLGDPAWLSLPGDVLASGVIATKADSVGGTTRQRFYRIEALP